MDHARRACSGGDWQRVLTDSVTVHAALLACSSTPGNEGRAMDYAGGRRGRRNWPTKGARGAPRTATTSGCESCSGNTQAKADALLQEGWHLRAWTDPGATRSTDEAVENSASETLGAALTVCRIQKQEALF